jgi:peptide/nickel transport system substrate-binding protein
MTINSGLRYSDGSPITASDYAFTALLFSSAQFAALGGAPTELDYLKGYAGYREGSPFAGVRLIDEMTFEMIIDGRFLPFFYEITWLNLNPYPVQVLAPGCVVKDDGEGAYIDGPFTERALRDTILDQEKGYLYSPAVTSGPYVLSSFDVESQAARFERNQLYAGNYEKAIPKVEEITVVFTKPTEGLDQLDGGKLNLVSRVSDGSVILEGASRFALGQVRKTDYLRTGFAHISFACELGPTRSAGLRKAVARCVDRNEICE